VGRSRGKSAVTGAAGTRRLAAPALFNVVCERRHDRQLPECGRKHDEEDCEEPFHVRRQSGPG
jgi:hypothetical protein